MVETRAVRRIWPGIALVGVIAVIALAASTAPEAEGRGWLPPACAGRPSVAAAPERASASSWYRQDAVVANGTLQGQTVVVGSAEIERPRAIELDPESFVAGPFGDMVLVGTDDGRRSRVSLVDGRRACAWPIADASEVVRAATVSPDGQAIYEMRVDRVTRADLGVWRRPLGGDAAVRVLEPIAPDERFGRTFATAFAWSADGRSLVVRSCAEIACRFRILDPETGEHTLIADPTLGDLVGLDGDRLVAHGACPGLPCPVLSVPLAEGPPIVLEPQAGLATMVVDDRGAARVVIEAGDGTQALRAMDACGRGRHDLAPDGSGHRLVPTDGRSGSGMALPPGWLAFGPEGRLPADGPRADTLRQIADGRSVDPQEVR